MNALLEVVLALQVNHVALPYPILEPAIPSMETAQILTLPPTTTPPPRVAAANQAVPRRFPQQPQAQVPAPTVATLFVTAAKPVRTVPAIAVVVVAAVTVAMAFVGMALVVVEERTAAPVQPTVVRAQWALAAALASVPIHCN